MSSGGISPRSSISRAMGATRFCAQSRAACWTANSDSENEKSIGMLSDHRRSLDLHHRRVVKEALDFDQRHRRVIATEIGAINRADGFEVREISGLVRDIERELDDVRHRSAHRLHHGLQILE